jgi:hypothetical protein
MSIVSRLTGSSTASAAIAYPQTGLPALSGVPTSDVPEAAVPQPYGTDSYQPVAYRVPTGTPALLPGAVTAWRAQETMMPEIATRQVASFKEIPVETAARAGRASRAARTVEAAEGASAAATETAAKAGRTASKAKAVSTAAEAGQEVAQGTQQVKTVKTKVQATPKLTTAGLWGAVKSSALVSGAVSLALNGYAVIKGQRTVAEAGSNVVGDVAAGAVGGVGGAVASAFGAPLIAGALGIAGGFPLTALTFGLGLGGYWLADKLFRNTGLFKSLKADVHSLLAGNPGAVQAPVASTAPAVNGYQALPQLP